MIGTLSSMAFPGLLAAGGSGTPNPGEVIIHHVADHGYGEWPLYLSKASVMMIVAALLVIFGIWRATRGYGANGVPKTRWAQMLDPFVEHFYRDVAIRFAGEKWAKKVAPLLLSFFFFILVCNLVGLLPFAEGLTLAFKVAGADAPGIAHGAATATGNFNVTMALAGVTFFAIIIFGIMSQGFIGHFAHLAPKGPPFVVRWFLLLPIETLSMFVKPFALTMRLAANMTAGHMGLLALMSMIFHMKSVLVGLPVAALALAITLLEIIVCFVQAYVFALLSGVFIGMALHPHH